MEFWAKKLDNLLKIAFSKTLLRKGRTDIGLKLDGSVLQPFLCIGVITARFNCEGNTALLKLKLIISAIILEKKDLKYFIILTGIQFAGSLVFFNFEIILQHSSEETGQR